MERRRLGRSDLTVPPLCFGCNVLGWTVDEATSFRLLDALAEAGLTFLDTADVYSRWAPGHAGGESEAIIGRWMKARGNRGSVTVATKVGMDMGEGRSGLAPAYIARAVDESLRRLGTDTIDLYQAHRDDPDTPLAETLGAFDRLIEAGKVRVIGASNISAPRFAEALAISRDSGLPRYETLQPEYNLVTRRDVEAELLPLCRENEVGVIPFYSLASGFLTGKYRSEADLGQSPRGERAVRRFLNERGLRILSVLDEVAAGTGAELATVALAWSMARPGITAPIASATSLAQLDALMAATRLSLPADAVAVLDRASD